MAGDGQRVAVVGGGVSGLTAAHELAERGFAVTVFEKAHALGGKARSQSYNDLPAEHGFRFFPGFYTHVIDTMRRIEVDEDHHKVVDHLVDLDTALITDGQGHRLTVPLPTAHSHPTWRERLRGIRSFRGALPRPWEWVYFLSVLARLVISCESRWDHQLERESWLYYAMPPTRILPRSKNYCRLFALGLTRTFVATRAEEMSARTGGRILLQLLYDTFAGPGERGGAADRALDGPTSTVWIEPWRKLLDERGVRFRLGCEVTALDVSATGPVRGLMVSERPVEEKFDFYVLALPCEVLKQLLVKTPQLVVRDRQLSRVFALQTRWMNGIVFGLDRPLAPPLPKGHVLCLDSPWALTLVDQSRIWSPEHLAGLRDRWPTLLSVDISDWETPGENGLPAEWFQPPRPEVAEEVWRQLGKHLRELGNVPCPPDSNLDHDVKWDGSPRLLTASPLRGMDRTNDEPLRGQIARQRTNDEPLLVNTAGSLKDRPTATTALDNLFVAGDHARTYTDFASMEAANEAARRAVNALLDRAGFPGERCMVCDLQDPEAWWFRIPQRWGRAADRIIFKLGLPVRPPFRSTIAAWVVLGLVSRLS